MSRHGAAAGGLALALLTVLGIVLTSGSSPYVVKAEFADAAGLRTDFAVRLQGVAVGRVAQITVTPRDTAIVKLELDPSVTPIGSGARASTIPSNLLGEKYVSLDEGDRRAALPSGTTIPLTRTSTSPELDQVLDSFNPDTRRATAIFLSEQGDALLGRGADLAATLRRLPGSLSSARQLVSGLGQDNVALGQLVDQSDRILTAVTPQRAALGRLVTSAQGAFATLTSREQALGATISAAPGAVAQLRHTLGALGSAAGPLGAAAAGLRATAPSLTQTLDAVPGFGMAARPALQAVTNASPVLGRLATVATPVVQALIATSGRLATFTRSLAPVSTIADRSIGTVLGVLEGWARAIAERDGVGHMYRIEALVPSNVLTSIFSTPAASATDRSRQARGAARPVQAARPQSNSQPTAPAPRGLGAITGASWPSGASGAGSPIGSLLDYLLGR